MRNILSYYISFFPLIIVLATPQPELIIVLVILPGIPFLGAFYRQLRFYDGLIASFGWVFIAFLLSETFSVLVINLVIFWGVQSVLFIHSKELQVRQLEQVSLLVNYSSEKKTSMDWTYMPLDKLQTWATMIQGTQPNRPFPVRVLLYKDLSFKLGGGIYYDTWYEAIVLLNQDLLNKLSPPAQTALVANQFAHLLQRDSENLKNLIFWLGLIISWSYAMIILLVEDEISHFYNEIAFQGLIVGLSLFVGVVILNYFIRQQEYQADLRAADLTSLNDVHSLYELKNNIIPEVDTSKLRLFFKRVLLSTPSDKERMEFIKRFADEIKSYSDEFTL
ncbi:MAG: M48 family metalloprotease [Candidatus Hodarchaeales archaeon]|jgi:Zn-dependent protease with chaperone function